MKVKLFLSVIIVTLCLCDRVLSQIDETINEDPKSFLNEITENDDPPFTILSGSLNKPDPQPFIVQRRVFTKQNINSEPYYYNKPKIPFEFGKQPAANNVDQTFAKPDSEPYYYNRPNIPFEYDKQPAGTNIDQSIEGYNYPKPSEPFPFPSTTPPPRYTTEFLPGATSKR